MSGKCLIIMAVYDTDDNKRTEYTIKSINSLIKTTDSINTRIIIVDNNSCKKTKKFLSSLNDVQNIYVIYNNENIGTAEAINIGIRLREKDEYVIKIDNDIVIHDQGWIDKMIECFERNTNLGILGLKRKDLPNSPFSEQYPTQLCLLPHENGQSWCVIELCQDIIGSCTMFNHKLLDKIGYLYQPSIYGFDDVLACERSNLAGFHNAFLPTINIDHVDNGENVYTDWKRKHAGMYIGNITETIHEYREGKKSIYYNPYK